MTDDAPRTMHDPAVRAARRDMLGQPHIASLAAYARHLRAMGCGEVPDFDPLDGGIGARVLFLFEKPGPMTAAAGGSGFISRDNDDRTAAATFDFMRQAGIPREATVIWNVIPWWNGTRKVTSEELHKGVEQAGELIRLLPGLRAVVLVGRKAARAEPRLAATGLTVFTSAHPSPVVHARWPALWEAIPGQWAPVRPILALSDKP